MSLKIYSYHADSEHQILPVLKWLRNNGEMNVDFTVVRMNYSQIHLQFHNEKLELMYTFQYDWTKPTKNVKG